MPASGKNSHGKIVFLDRDGVINEYPGDRAYVKSWQEFRFLPYAAAAIKRLNQAGFGVYVISNQAGVSKGVFSAGALDTITRAMRQELARYGANISDVFCCTHKSEDNCACRKPKTGFIDGIISKLRAAGSDIDLGRSFFIGDTEVDIQTGRRAGVKTILVFSGKEKPGRQNAWKTPPDFTARDLSEAVDIILKNSCC